MPAIDTNTRRLLNKRWVFVKFDWPRAGNRQYIRPRDDFEVDKHPSIVKIDQLMSESKSSTASLLPLVATGDANAVRACIDRYSPLIWSLAKRKLGNTAEAEDAVQEIFIQIWKIAERFDPTVASETTFVAMIARRRLIDRQRKLERISNVHSLDVIGSPAIEGSTDIPSLETQEQAEKIETALASLNDDQRRALRHSIVDGWSHNKIAEKLGQPLGTVKTNIRRGLLRVREMLGAASDSVVRAES